MLPAERRARHRHRGRPASSRTSRSG